MLFSTGDHETIGRPITNAVEATRMYEGDARGVEGWEDVNV
jgi:hypothetical protein